MQDRTQAGTDHFGTRARRAEQFDTRLSKGEAKEQLLYDLRDQLGQITFTVREHPDETDAHGDGTVIAKINGREADHYIYHDVPRWEDRDSEGS